MRSRTRRPRPLWLLASTAACLAACDEEPEPPEDCTVAIAEVQPEWLTFHRLVRDLDLDSLRAVIAQERDDAQRLHFVQEYVMVANELPAQERVRAIDSLEQVLARTD